MKKITGLSLLLALCASGASAQNHTATVAAVKADLLAHPRPDLPVNLQGKCGAFAITMRVVWALKSEGWGLVHSDGSGCVFNGEIYRADSTVKQDGTTIDMLDHSEDNEGDTHDPNAFNIPAWNTPQNPQPGSNWRQPIMPDPGSTPLPPVDPPQPPASGFDPAPLLSRIGALEKLTDALAAQVKAIDAELKVERDRVNVIDNDVTNLKARKIPIDCEAHINLGATQIPISCNVQY